SKTPSRKPPRTAAKSRSRSPPSARTATEPSFSTAKGTASHSIRTRMRDENQPAAQARVNSSSALACAAGWCSSRTHRRRQDGTAWRFAQFGDAADHAVGAEGETVKIFQRRAAAQDEDRFAAHLDAAQNISFHRVADDRRLLRFDAEF